MPSKESKTRIVNHKFLRQGTGLIALLLPFVAVWLSGEPELTSISASYWTDSGDIFVGSLVAVAFFLAAYNGTGNCRKDSEFYISKFAGLFALLVALVPTNCTFIDCSDIPNWVSTVTFNNTQFVHNFSAIALFVCLFLLITLFARRAKYKGSLTRSRFYSAISLCMVIGMPLVYFLGNYIDWYEPIYGVEFVGLILFGIGWISAGTYKKRKDEADFTNVVKLGVFHVDPQIKNFPTDIKVKAGEEYLFKAKGCWKDSILSCGPNGWGPLWNPLVLKNRLKGNPVFMLCGNVGKSWNDPNLTFTIGDHVTWEIPNQVNDLDAEDQKLYLFANDWKERYDNNSGIMEVTIYKL